MKNTPSECGGDISKIAEMAVDSIRVTAFLGDRADIGIWEGIVVYEYGNYLNTISWPGV